MSFRILKSTCDEFRELLRVATGRELIATVSVDEPTDPEDELHFFKLLTWCYVFVFEASQPAGKYISSLLRVAKPGEHRIVSATFETVNHLRTVRVHNLSVQNSRDDYKRRQAHIWLVQNGGNPRDWSACCSSLGNQVDVAIRCLMNRWREVTVAEVDALAVVKELIIAVDREWPPHLFDRIVEDAARDIGLRGLDSTKYREGRLDRWRDLINCFESREHAEAAINAAIRRELEQVFGAHLPDSSVSTIS